MRKSETVLQQYFGYPSFRPLQKEIVEAIISGHDSFVLMPTGAGKSICYQVPALLFSGVTIVVSPLISLMKDQVDGLVQNGIAAAYFNSSLSKKEQQEILNQLQENKIKLLYVAPERLVQPEFIDLLKQITVSLFAIDEAHCISEWGHDFRPEYKKLHLLKEQFPNIPIAALTATATERVKEDIIKNLRLNDVHIFTASFNRSNLHYTVIPKNGLSSQVLAYLKNHSGESGVIYCQSREKVDRMTKVLSENGIKALSYHAGLDDTTRQKNQEHFIKEDIDVIVATIAFGMGIDKPNVRFVIHADLPSNIERYYQETGRAGRDGLQSECVLFYSYADKTAIEFFIHKKSIVEQEVARKLLRKMVDFAETKTCRRKLLLGYFGESFPEENCQTCDNCASPPEKFDGTIITQKILSCVYRVGQRFGAGYIISVLTGVEDEKIKRNNHTSISTFGIVNDFSKNQLRSFIQELIHLDYLKQTQDQYPVLKLGAKSTAVLKNKQQVMLYLPVIKKEKKSKKILSENPELFERLRFLRKELATKQNVPPYIIFSDVTLSEMAALCPKNQEEFATIRGVGKQKLMRYADSFLNEIISYTK